MLAVEVNPEACNLIRENVQGFGLDNVQVVEGMAPAVLGGLPPPDRVLIGGSGGQLEGILRACQASLRPGGIIVINAITVETLSTALAGGSQHGYRVEALATNLARLETAGRHHIWRALNPVYIVKLAKKCFPEEAGRA
ncbi:MAG: hypothetical protein PWQ18_1284 [Clostridia bacterium]|nr:hypothetical protein [Clostridia bacterium]